MKKGAIFDQDGLMFDSEALYRKAWNAVGKELGFDVPDNFFPAVCGSSGSRMIEIVRSFFPEIDVEDYIQKVFRMSHVLQDTELEEKKGLRLLLDYFRDNGVRMAVASSTVKERILKNLTSDGILDYFDVIVSGDQVEHGKPAPDIFLLAADQLGLAATECYVLEDSFNGVKAGKAAGCCTIMVPDLVPPDDEIARIYDICCEDLEVVKEKIQAGEI